MLSFCPHRSDWSGFFLTVSSMQVPRCVLNFSCLAIFLHMEILFRKPSIPADILFLNNLKIVKYLSSKKGSHWICTCHVQHSIWNHVLSPCILQFRLELVPACHHFCLNTELFIFVDHCLRDLWNSPFFEWLFERFAKSPHFNSNLQGNWQIRCTFCGTGGVKQCQI